MSIWRVCGGRGLAGSTRVPGAKNAVLPILAAAVVTGCETELLNCPQIDDVDVSLDILCHLGCNIDRDGDVLNIDSRGMTCSDIPEQLMTRMRSSLFFLGAILARCGEARLSRPGGCELGERPIDIHLNALRALGAEVFEDNGSVLCRADQLKGADVTLPFPSVGATENIMLAACAATGRTIIHNAAREPEIVELQGYLRMLGAEITGAGTNTVEINGFTPVRRVGHRIMPDRIVASTYLCAAAACGGEIELKNAMPENFQTVINVLSQMGCTVKAGGGNVSLKSSGVLRAPSRIVTAPYPGFPTDAQPLIMAASLKAAGQTHFDETIFENRFRQARELNKLGADITVTGTDAVVSGVSRLYGTQMQTTDLRGGAALVVAAMSAEGESIITDNGHITRGYDSFDRALTDLGADVTIL